MELCQIRSPPFKINPSDFQICFECTKSIPPFLIFLRFQTTRIVFTKCGCADFLLTFEEFGFIVTRSEARWKKAQNQRFPKSKFALSPCFSIPHSNTNKLPFALFLPCFIPETAHPPLFPLSPVYRRHFSEFFLVQNPYAKTACKNRRCGANISSFNLIPQSIS